MKSKIFVGCCLMVAVAMGQVSHVVSAGHGWCESSQSVQFMGDCRDQYPGSGQCRCRAGMDQCLGVQWHIYSDQPGDNCRWYDRPQLA